MTTDTDLQVLQLQLTAAQADLANLQTVNTLAIARQAANFATQTKIKQATIDSITAQITALQTAPTE